MGCNAGIRHRGTVFKGTWPRSMHQLLNGPDGLFPTVHRLLQGLPVPS